MTYVNIRHMKRTTLFIPEGLDRRLQSFMRRSSKSMAAVVREALEAHLDAHQPPAGLPSFLGKYDSGQSDTASRLDEFVFRDLQPHEPAAPAGDRRQK